MLLFTAVLYAVYEMAQALCSFFLYVKYIQSYLLYVNIEMKCIRMGEWFGGE